MVEAVKTLWMGAIQPTWNKTFIHSLFCHTGEELSVKIVRNSQNNGNPSGYAFVEFQTHDTAKRVLESFNGKQIPGTQVVFRLNWGHGGKGSAGTLVKEYSIFVGDLAPEVTDMVLKDFFLARFKSTSSAKVITDPATGQSKAFGFVRFLDEAEHHDALSTMNNKVLCSKAIRVNAAIEKKQDTNNGGGGTHRGDQNNLGEDERFNTTVFVGNLDASVTEGQLIEHFKECGEIWNVRIPSGRGCGFVRFSNHVSAQAAIDSRQETELGPTRIRLAWGRQSQSNANNNALYYGNQPVMMSQMIGMYPQYPYVHWQPQHVVSPNPYYAIPQYPQAYPANPAGQIPPHVYPQNPYHHHMAMGAAYNAPLHPQEFYETRGGMVQHLASAKSVNEAA